MSARRGASPAVVRALEGSFTNVSDSGPRTHPCPKCGAGTLRFTFGDYGQSLENCDNMRCLNSVPHHPEPDPVPEQGRGAQGMRKRGPNPTNKSAKPRLVQW